MLQRTRGRQGGASRSALVLATALVVGLGGSKLASAQTKASGSPTSGSAPSSALLAQAKQEGKLVWYSSSNPSESGAVVAAYRKKYGIDVQVLQQPSILLVPRYGAEAQSGKVIADVINTSEAAFFHQASEKGWFAKLTTSVVPHLADWPADSLVDGTTIQTHGSPQGISVNTNNVRAADMPRTWQDLLKPRFAKGRLLLLDPRVSPNYLVQYYLLYKTYGADYLRKLAAQNPMIVQSAVTGNESLAAGEGDVLLPSAETFAASIIAKGAPLRWYVLSPSTHLWQLLAMSAKAPHPAAARLMVDFLLTKEGARLLNGEFGVTAIPGYSKATLPEGYVPPELAAALARRTEIVGLLGLK